MKSLPMFAAFARASMPCNPRMVMPARLLQRQISLLEYLTSADAIFGEGIDAPPVPHLQGFDLAPLRLEACFSHEKRMEKIIAAFPRTFELLADQATVIRDFVAACPSVDIRRIENARQFYDFVCARWETAPPQPPYLRDVASCELAIATIRIKHKARPSQPVAAGHTMRFRRNRNAVFLPCTYDIRSIFEGHTSEGHASEAQASEAPARRDVMLAILIPPGAEQPAIFEVSAPVYALLVELDIWTDRATLGPMEGLDELIADLADHGLLEVSR
jgi:hypothetical protein